MKKLLDYLCLGVLGLFVAALAIGSIAVFIYMGVGCYQINGNLPAALVLGTIPFWAVAAFRGACIMIERDNAAKGGDADDRDNQLRT